MRNYIHLIGLVLVLSTAAQAEVLIYDPAAAQWSALSKLEGVSGDGDAVLLGDGRLLVCQTTKLQWASAPYPSCSIFDFATSQWKAASLPPFDSQYDRVQYFTDKKLIAGADGRILMVGGWWGDYDPFFSYDPQTDLWQALPKALARTQFMVNGVILPDRRLLTFGNYVRKGELPAPAQIYDPQTQQWQSAGVMTNPVQFDDGEAFIDSKGRVLILGGDAVFSRRPGYRDVRLDISRYTPGSPGTGDPGKWDIAFTLPEGAGWGEHVQIAQDRLMVIGGFSEHGYGNSSWEVDMQTGAAKELAKRNFAGGFYPMIAATRLKDGRVMVAGSSEGDYNQVEIYDPDKNHWTIAAPIPTQIGFLNSTAFLKARLLPLPDGRVVLYGWPR